MSVKNRLEDAGVLFTMNRHEGALLSILIALAGTARKRYPKKNYKDKQSFVRFFKEEFSKYIPGQINLKFRERICAVEEIFYEFVRCELVHEAELPEDIRFSDQGHPGFFGMDVQPKLITFSGAV